MIFARLTLSSSAFGHSDQTACTDIIIDGLMEQASSGPLLAGDESSVIFIASSHMLSAEPSPMPDAELP